MAFSLRRTAGLVSVALLALAGCGEPESDRPTAAQAGATLKEHITQLLDKVGASDVQVTDPGDSDIPCGDGKAKRTYGVTATENVGSGDSGAILLALVGALDEVAEYDAVGEASDASRRELRNARHHTRIILESPGNRRIVVRGETSCLAQ
jgi:hypothetical protein